MSNGLVVASALFLAATLILGGLFRLLRPRRRSQIDARKLSTDEQLAFLAAAVMMV